MSHLGVKENKVNGNDLSRRGFFRKALPLVCLSGLTSASGGAAPDEDKGEAQSSNPVYELRPIGRVEKTGSSARLRIFDDFSDGLLGLDDWSHVIVLYWFDKNDTPSKRSILRVHPRGDKQNPLTGVFACRAPVRPNLIALTVCEILSLESDGIIVKEIDAFDGTPLLDLKPYIPPGAPAGNVRRPEWVKRKKK